MDGTYGTMLLIPAGGEMSEAAVLPIFFGTAHYCLTPRYGPARLNRLYLSLCGSVGLTAVQLAS
ncbi:hypothetical protein KPHVMX_190104 [Klebsiella pneumoniae]|nr:hypothetical protein KPHVMX_190104 [Klebsiella pneumoniae]